MRAERGFTLIEVLVVVALIGILAAIALPIMTRQRQSGFDTEAKSAARTAEGVVERLAIELGDYDLTRAQLLAEDPQLADGPQLDLVTSRTGYAITVTASGGHTFAVERAGFAAPATRTCAPAGAGACGPGGRW